MPRIEERIEIAASSPTIFHLCHDAARRPEWDKRIKRIELITPGPVRQGTLFQVDASTPSGSVFGWEGEFSEFKYPTSATLRVLDAALSSPFKSGVETWRFDSMGDTTRVTVVWDYQTRNVITRIIDAAVGRSATRRSIRHSLANLKAMAENS
jgi:ribosome-associated toxin RatA of RatAB toxin-antitoxin module